MDVASVADHGGASGGDANIFLLVVARLCIAIRIGIKSVKDVLVEDGYRNPCDSGLKN